MGAIATPTLIAATASILMATMMITTTPIITAVYAQVQQTNNQTANNQTAAVSEGYGYQRPNQTAVLERHQQLKEIYEQQKASGANRPTDCTPITVICEGETAPTTTPTPAAPSTTTNRSPLPATTDPELERIREITNNCQTTIQRLYPGADEFGDVFMKPPLRGQATSADYDQMRQCNLLLNQAQTQYCEILQTYDETRCAYVNRPQVTNVITLSYVIALSTKSLLAGELPFLN